MRLGCPSLPQIRPVRFGGFQLVDKPSPSTPQSIHNRYALIRLSEGVRNELGTTSPYALLDGLHLAIWGRLSQVVGQLSGEPANISANTSSGLYKELSHWGLSAENLKNNRELGQAMVDTVVLSLARHPAESEKELAWLRTQKKRTKEGYHTAYHHQISGVIGLSTPDSIQSHQASLLDLLGRLDLTAEERQRAEAVSRCFDEDLGEIVDTTARHYFFRKDPPNPGAVVRCLLQGPPEGKPALEILKTIQTLSSKRFFLGRWISPGVKRDKLMSVGGLRTYILLLEMLQNRGLVKLRLVETKPWNDYRVVLTPKGKEALAMADDPVKALGLSNEEYMTYLQEEISYLNWENAHKQQAIQRLEDAIEQDRAVINSGYLRIDKRAPRWAFIAKQTLRLAELKKEYTQWHPQYLQEKTRLEESLFKLTEGREVDRLENEMKAFTRKAQETLDEPPPKP